MCESVAKGHSGDRCDLASTLCKYDLRKGDFFVLSCCSPLVLVRLSPGSCLEIAEFPDGIHWSAP